MSYKRDYFTDIGTCTAGYPPSPSEYSLKGADGPGTIQYRIQATEVWPPIQKGSLPPINPVTFDKVERWGDDISVSFLYYYLPTRPPSFKLEYFLPSGMLHVQAVIAAQLRQYSDFSQREKDLAYTASLAKVGQADWLASNDLGEIKETLSFIKRPLGSLRDLADGFTKKRRIRYERGMRGVENKYRRKRRRIQEWSKASADTWLEMRYALMPLIYSASDLGNLCGYLASKYDVQVRTAKGTWKDTESISVFNGGSGIEDGLLKHGRAVQIDSVIERKIVYAIRYYEKPWMQDAAALAHAGLSPTQLLSTIWELTPYSFVGDWAWSFGDWLKAMEPKPHIQVVDVCESKKWHEYAICYDRGGNYTYYTLPQLDAKCYFKRDRLIRKSVTGTLQAPTPRLKGKLLGIMQILDSLALLLKPIQKAFGSGSTKKRST